VTDRLDKLRNTSISEELPSCNTAEDIVQYEKKWANHVGRLAEDVSKDWLCGIIRAEDVFWGDHNRDGKSKSIFNIKRKKPECT
jgi:hypothetical protein